MRIKEKMITIIIDSEREVLCEGFSFFHFKILLPCLLSADYKLHRGRNPVYSLLYLHNPVPLAARRRAQEIFPERKKREGKKNRRKKESRRGN